MLDRGWIGRNSLHRDCSGTHKDPSPARAGLWANLYLSEEGSLFMPAFGRCQTSARDSIDVGSLIECRRVYVTADLLLGGTMRHTHLKARLGVLFAAALMTSIACAPTGLAAIKPVSLAESPSSTRVVSETSATRVRTVSAVHYRLKSFVVPRTAKRLKWFIVRVAVTPRYGGSGRVVTFYLQGWTGARWKTVNHRAVRRSSGTSVFRIKVKLGRGSWRMRARFHKSGHPTSWTHYKSIRVK